MTDLRTKLQNLQYKGTPVFGRDSNPQNTSEFVAIAGTVFFWLIVFLFLLIAKPFNKKNDFKPVQIVLSSTPVAKTEKKESSAAAAAPAQKAQSTEKKTDTNQIKQVTEKAVADKPKTESKPTQKQQQPEPTFEQNYLDPMEAFNNQLSKNKPKDYGNYDPFANMNDNNVEATSSQTYRVETASTSSGSAGNTSSADSSGGSSIVQSDNHGVVNTVGSDTSRALHGIASIQEGSAGQFSTNVKDTDGTGSAVSKTEGFGHSGRSIISAAPINISEKNAETITSNLTFEITFKIQPSGVVSKSEIEFESKANVILTNAVIDEIKTIIAKWTFSPASNISVAKFSLTIQRK
ncbi:MAG: hypothetical protein K6C98_04100 [Treponema sp.]|nr:hypothetical protein [Treponema sp.]